MAILIVMVLRVPHWKLESLGYRSFSYQGPEARCLPLSESEGKLGSYAIPKYALCNGCKDESETEVVSNKTLNSRDNYLCVIITLSPNQDLKKKKKKKLMGKLNEKKNQQQIAARKYNCRNSKFSIFEIFGMLHEWGKEHHLSNS